MTISNIENQDQHTEELLMRSRCTTWKIINIVLGAISLPIYFIMFVFSFAAWPHASTELKAIAVLIVVLVVLMLVSFIISIVYWGKQAYKKSYISSVISTVFASMPLLLFLFVNE